MLAAAAAVLLASGATLAQTEAPSLAGQSAVYLTKALNDYRSGARKNDMMSLVAPTLKEQDVEDLAAYYSAIEVTVTPPPK
jgi:cytochrome c553